MRFKTILADCPWKFSYWSPEKAHRKVPYEIQEAEWLGSLPVQDVCEEDCVLFMWVTWPNLLHGLRVIEDWGFCYKTLAFIWVKKTHCNLPKMNLGLWSRANSEPCLLATKGSPKRLDKGVNQVLVSGLGEHSEKPEESYQRIERLVDGPYLELFGRRRRDGWTVIGNEIDGLDITESLRMVAEDKELPVIHRGHPSLFDPAIITKQGDRE